MHAFKISDAVRHVASADGGRLQHVIARCGAPDFYHHQQEHDKGDTFRSLSRIIVGQQLAGAAVKAIWAKFLDALAGDVTPAAVLAQKPEALRAAAGLSGAKCRAIFDLAAHYERGNLSNAILLNPQLSEAELSSKLLAVKGVGTAAAAEASAGLRRRRRRWRRSKKNAVAPSKCADLRKLPRRRPVT